MLKPFFKSANDAQSVVSPPKENRQSSGHHYFLLEWKRDQTAILCKDNDSEEKRC